MAILQIKDSEGNFINVPSIQGEPGKSGVYYGTEEPTDADVNVWIDPSGDAIFCPDTFVFNYLAEGDALIAEAQRVYDTFWLGTEPKNFIMTLGGSSYVPAQFQVWGTEENVMDHFDIYTDMGMFSYGQDSDSIMQRQLLGWSFTLNGDTVTECTGPVSNTHIGNYLDPYGLYSTPFIPTDPCQPATKQYVDNAIAATFTLEGTSLYITTNAEMPSITFHVQNPDQTDTYYSFEIPNVMTWQEFIDSEYNTVPFHDGYGYPAVSSANGHIYSWNVLLSESIIDGHFYDVSWTGEIE